VKILAIETSCDETAIALIEAEGTPSEGGVSFYALSNVVHSQVELHAEYGGVFPTIAKREHTRNLVPALEKALEEADSKMSNSEFLISNQFSNDTIPKIRNILVREKESGDALTEFLQKHPEKPNVDAIAVTHGPGLEPALWVGINFAEALSEVWNLPVLPVNHMEGHLVSALLQAETRNSKSEILNPKQFQNSKFKIQNIQFPVLGLLVSGGHTELVLSRDWLEYELIGQTRDDAAGEAFDKAARILGLPYPGGPEIAKRADENEASGEAFAPLPRPMLDSGDFDFSFSGLKTAVRYRAETMELTPEVVNRFAYEFQEAATDVLVLKTLRAAKERGAKTIAVGGGVSANERLREKMHEKAREDYPEAEIRFAPRVFTGDNALMIAAAAYLRSRLEKTDGASADLEARGSLQLAA